MLERGDGLRRRPLAEEGRGGSARQRPDPDEDQERDAEEDRDEKQEPADDESQHVCSPSAGSLLPRYPTETVAKRL